MNFLLPCEPFNVKRVDFDFRKEFNSITSLGFKASLYDHDSFVSTGDLITDCNFNSSGDIMVLRSWMLTGDQYRRIYENLEGRGIYLINTPSQYLNCHYYPNIHDKISSHTPKCVWFSDLSDTSIIENRRKFGNVDLVIKDYVKSDKGLDGIFKLESSLNDEEFCDKVNLFKEARHGLFAEGIVLKEFVPLKFYGSETNEYRIFVLDHSIISISQNTELKYGKSPNVSFLSSIIRNIDSNYFTIDIAETVSGEWIIIECGDGGVSGLSPHQNELIYYMNFHNIKKNVNFV